MCHLWLISLCEKIYRYITYQIFIGIIPIFSENFIQSNQGFDHFIIDSLQNPFIGGYQTHVNSENGLRHGLRTPNEDINQIYLKKWADVADKICCRLT